MKKRSHDFSFAMVRTTLAIAACITCFPLLCYSFSWRSNIRDSQLVRRNHPRGNRVVSKPTATCRRRESCSALGTAEDANLDTTSSTSSTTPAERGETVGEKPQQLQQPWLEEERKTKGTPTLTAQTQWRMMLSLRDPTLEEGKGEVTEVAVRVRFDEDVNFEPPQGSLEVIEDNMCFAQQEGNARWTLSEEEDKRAAGLWIWGLFKEPLYPFLLLQIQNLDIELRGGGKIPAGQMFVKVDHRRDADLGPTLNSGTVGVRSIERVTVDPLGMADADIASVVPCGTVRFRPV